MGGLYIQWYCLLLFPSRKTGINRNGKKLIHSHSSFRNMGVQVNKLSYHVSISDEKRKKRLLHKLIFSF